MSNVKRTIDDHIATPGAQPDLPGMPPQGWGVGNAPSPLSHVGGGYLSICMPFEFSLPDDKKNFRDPRIGQLEAMGMRRTFIKVAEAIGFEAFMTMWQIFDADPSLRDQGPSAMRIVMRPYSAWQRFQRNRFIEQLLAMGLTDDEVSQRLAKQFDIEFEAISVRRFRKRSNDTGAHSDKRAKNHVANNNKKG